jgi:hypothetical protein
MWRTSELDVIRFELERLVEKRFSTGLTAAEQAVYERFSGREIELLRDELATAAA